MKKSYLISSLLFVLFLLILLTLAFVLKLNHFNKTSDSTNSTQNIPENSNSELGRPISTIVFTGDTGTGSEKQYKVAQSILWYCQQYKCDSMYIAGDVIYDTGVKSKEDEQFTTKFEKPYENFHFPIYIAYGNHDYAGCIDCYIAYSDRSTKWTMPGRYYRIGGEFDISVFVIDTENFDSTQADWLRQNLEGNKNGTNIVVGHRPLVTYEVLHMGDQWNGKDLLKNTICEWVDVYISGHSHLLEDNGSIEGCHVIQIVSGGGGAEPRIAVPNPSNVFNYQGNGFIVLNGYTNRLTLEFRDENGNLRYTRELPYY